MIYNITPEHITRLKHNEIFVFGSNTEGRHGKGAAKIALKFGAIYGMSKGFQGKTYAIITKDLFKGKRGIPLSVIENQINDLLIAVKKYPVLKFLITPIGCELAGYTPKEIAPMFNEFIKFKNVFLPMSFWEVLIK